MTDTRFKPGECGKGRRPRGKQNKITRDLKEGIIEAACQHGSDGHGAGGLVGYLKFAAHKHPKAFCQLLGRLMPLQVNGDVRLGVAAVNILTVPEGQYLTPEQVNAHYPQLPTPAEFIGEPPEDPRPNAEVITLRPNQ